MLTAQLKYSNHPNNYVVYGSKLDNEMWVFEVLMLQLYSAKQLPAYLPLVEERAFSIELPVQEDTDIW